MERPLAEPACQAQCIALSMGTQLRFDPLAGLPWRGDNSKLYQHTQGVCFVPVLDDLPACDAQDINALERHLLPGWGDLHKRSLLCSNVGEADCDLVPYREHILNRAVQVRESRQERVGEVFYLLQITLLTDRESVVDDGGVEAFVESRQMLLVVHLLAPTAYKGHVVFG